MVYDSNKKKLPVDDRPLRQAGQSLKEEQDKILDEKILPYLAISVTFVLIAALEWHRSLRNLKPQPVFYTWFAAAVVIVSTIMIRKHFKEAKNLTTGIKGEKAVGEMLEELRADGYRVFHDMVGDDFNVDHVLIGPGGVFSVETKTVKKPSGYSSVVYNGESVTVNGMTPDRDPLVQARAQKNWLQKLIKKQTSKDITVQPAVLYPGWYVETETAARDIWVLNEIAFIKWVKNKHETLKTEDIALIASGLEQYIRNCEKQ